MEKTQLVMKKPVHMEITLKPGLWIEPTKYFDKIAEAGYAARREEVLLTLTGTLEKEDGRLVFMMPDVKPQPVKLVVLERKGKNAEETRQSAEAHRSASELTGRPVEVEGWWKPPLGKTKESLSSVLIVSVRPIKRVGREP